MYHQALKGNSEKKGDPKSYMQVTTIFRLTLCLLKLYIYYITKVISSPGEIENWKKKNQAELRSHGK